MNSCRRQRLLLFTVDFISRPPPDVFIYKHSVLRWHPASSLCYIFLFNSSFSLLYYSLSFNIFASLFFICVIVRWICFTLDNGLRSQEGLDISHHADNTLKSFCKWQATINPETDDHPNHHDVAILLTRFAAYISSYVYVQIYASVI